jgi:nucleotide-binding universal stress UspA family protein
MYTNILIPTDGSELAGKAVQHGIALAKRIGARVTVLTVLPPFHTFTTDAQMIEDTPDQYKARCSSMLRKLLAPWLRRRKQQALHVRQSRPSMNIPTWRSSTPQDRAGDGQVFLCLDRNIVRPENWISSGVDLIHRDRTPGDAIDDREDRQPQPINYAADLRKHRVFSHGRQWSAGTDARAPGAPVEVDPLAASKTSPDGCLILHATHIANLSQLTSAKTALGRADDERRSRKRQDGGSPVD